ncbi:MAG: DUF58 domain-containing protein [Lachnospiraceae bacterium]|nr:DUF58 domain-containing protein [Lachnospiraceae bacterium]
MEILLLIAGAGLIYWLQNALYKKYWAKNLSVSIHFQEKPVLEGEDAHLTEVIENRKILPLSYLNVKFKISRYLEFENMENTSTSDWIYKNDIFSVLFHQRITRNLTFHCRKRGYYTINQADIVSANLLMTNGFVQALPQDTHIYVYPRAIDLGRLDVPFKKMMGSLVSKQFLYEDPFEFRGLRDYARTDPMSSINWKAWAKTGELMVNVHDSTSSQEAVVFLNLEDETVWKYDQLHEVAIRIAAALCYRFLNASIPTRILCNGMDILTNGAAVLPAGTGLRQVNTINEILARIDLTKETIPCINLVEELKSRPDSSASMPLYVMISNCMRQDLQQSFASLAAHSAGAMWIAPLYDDMELHVEQTPQMDVVRWEVDRYEA